MTVRARLQKLRVFAQRFQRLSGQTIDKPDSAFALQKARPRTSEHANADAIVVAATMIQHYARAASGFQHPMNLAYGARRVRRVVQDAVRVNEIERLIGEIQVLCVSRAKLTAQAEQFEVFSRQLNRRIGQINSGVVGACFGELGSISSQAATYFQHAQPARAGKVSGLGNVPFFRVAMCFDALEKFARAYLGVGELGAAGMRLPKGAHALLEFGIRVDYFRGGT